MSEETPESGKCFECGADCSQEHYCFGCKEFVCEECSVNDSLMGSHIPEDHLNEPEVGGW